MLAGLLVTRQLEVEAPGPQGSHLRDTGMLLCRVLPSTCACRVQIRVECRGLEKATRVQLWRLAAARAANAHFDS